MRSGASGRGRWRGRYDHRTCTASEGTRGVLSALRARMDRHDGRVTDSLELVRDATDSGGVLLSAVLHGPPSLASLSAIRLVVVAIPLAARLGANWSYQRPFGGGLERV